MLSDAARQVVSGTKIESASGFALEDIGPECHGKEKARKSWPIIFWLPGTDSNPAEDGISAGASTEYDYVVNPACSGTLPTDHSIEIA